LRSESLHWMHRRRAAAAAPARWPRAAAGVTVARPGGSPPTGSGPGPAPGPVSRYTASPSPFRWSGCSRSGTVTLSGGQAAAARGRLGRRKNGSGPGVRSSSHWALGHGSRSLTVQASRVGPGYAIDPESSWRQWSRSARPSHCDRSESTKVLHRISSESDSQTQARTVSGGQGVTVGSDRRRSCITVTYFNLESEPWRQLLVNSSYAAP
jgi:hypothetical protein